MRNALALLFVMLGCSGCAVVSVAGTVVSTAASVAGTVIETTVDVAGAAMKTVVNAVTPSSEATPGKAASPSK